MNIKFKYVSKKAKLNHRKEKFFNFVDYQIFKYLIFKNKFSVKFFHYYNRKYLFDIYNADLRSKGFS